MKQPFISFDLHQEVNQWLCFMLVGLSALLVVIFYLVNRAEAFGNNYVSNVTVMSRIVPSATSSDLTQ